MCPCYDLTNNDINLGPHLQIDFKNVFFFVKDTSLKTNMLNPKIDDVADVFPLISGDFFNFQPLVFQEFFAVHDLFLLFEGLIIALLRPY